MAIGNLQGIPTQPPYTDETVNRVKDLLNAGSVDLDDVSQYFNVPKSLVMESLTEIPADAFTSGSLTDAQVEAVSQLVRKGVASTGDVSEYFNAPTQVVEDYLRDVRGYNEAQLVEARAGLPISPARAEQPAPTPQPTPTPTPQPQVQAQPQYQLPATVATQYATGSEIPTGLRGSEMALKGGAAGAIEMLDMLNRAGRSDLAEQYAKGLEQAATQADVAAGYIQPFQQAGQAALQQQLALSGALGPEAFQQAYQESPQVQFLREQGERSVMRNAAAMGGLGGGNVQKELQRFGQGLASQGLQQQISNLSGLTGVGQQASGTLANIATGLGGQQLSTQVGLGSGLAGQSSMYGLPAAQTIGNLGINLAAGRTQAGRDLANQYGAAATALGNIYGAQGQNIASMLGGQRNMIIDQINAAATNEARAQQGYGADLANIQQGIGTAIAGVPNVPITTPDYANQAMNALYAAGTGYQMFNQPAQTPATGVGTYTGNVSGGWGGFLGNPQNYYGMPANAYQASPQLTAAGGLTQIS